jgi:ATP-binding cassette, subfamily B, bacterial
MTPSGLLWPAALAPDSVDALARAARLVSPGMTRASGGLGEDGVDRAILRAAEQLGLVAEPVPLLERDLRARLAAGRPLLLVPRDGAGVVAVLGWRRGRAILLAPDGTRTPAGSEAVRAMGAPGVDDDPFARVAREAGFTGKAEARVRDAIRQDASAGRPWGAAFPLTASPAAALGGVLRDIDVARSSAVVLAAVTLQTLCVVLAWWVLGRGALSGSAGRGWLTAFFLLLLSVMPLQALGRMAQGRMAYRFGRLLRARLHQGALSLTTEEARAEGTGRMLGRVFESARLEVFSLGAAFAALLGAIQLPVAMWVLGRGAGGMAGPMLLAAAVLAAALLTVRHYRRLAVWTQLRNEHTHRLVELMLGHRTRLAQERAAHRHREEDQELARMVAAAREADDTMMPLVAALPRAFFTAGLLVQGAALLGHADLPLMALGLAGTLLGYGALQVLSIGAHDLCRALLAWRQVSALCGAAERRALAPSSMLPEMAAATPAGTAALEARHLGFTYPGRTQAALDHVELALRPGERVLLEGPTGSGKSTLVALLGGLRHPTAGAVLLRGLDRRMWGDAGWRRRVVLAPQFQENHLFAASLAFNLLLGRRWPPHPEDLAEAEEVCQELGLGPLLQRMPAFLMQPVGDTGWQLSHGERTRVFLARALLQRADVVLLDECFAALDPATLRSALACARRRAGTLLVVAHP